MVACSEVSMKSDACPDVLYRYLSVGRDSLDLFRRGRLWFSDPGRFNDPFDILPAFTKQGKRLRATLEAHREQAFWNDFRITGGRAAFLKKNNPWLENELAKRLRKLQAGFHRDVCNRFWVTCLSELHKSLLMWSYYGDCHRGICIGLSPGHIPVPPDKGYRWKVSYRRKRVAFDPSNAARIALSKAREWKHEREWRILMATEDLIPGKRPIPRQRDGRRSVPGFYLEISSRAVSSVWLGPRIKSTARSEVLKLLGAADWAHVKVVQLHLSHDEFGLEEELIQHP